MSAKITVKDLWVGDRFTNAGRLYTYLEPVGDGENAHVRYHSPESRKLGERGYGYLGDSILTIPLLSPAEFQPS